MNQQEISLGLRANWIQFSWLVLVNGLVGAMIGLERSLMPAFAKEVFQLDAHTAMLSFIAVFGLSKAMANYMSGKWANALGRKRLLVLGWILALPVPLIFIMATEWYQIGLANVLLGISQGLTWSSTVVMKIDLVGEKNRGLALGINESAGYLAVGGMAFLTSWMAEHWGIRPYPFYLGFGLAWIGLGLSWWVIKDTFKHTQKEGEENIAPNLKSVFWETSLTHKTLSAVTWAGLVNNLNDGMMWGLFPVLLAHLAYSQTDIGWLVAIYPVVWGLGQLFTGALADRWNVKWMLVAGMVMQGLAILMLVMVASPWLLAAASVVLGLGTAMVYPTFMKVIAQETHPNHRAEAFGAYRWWRDIGYVVGAILSGVLADLWNISLAITAVGLLTLGAAAILGLRMKSDGNNLRN
jgi:MFS family permease